jgi:hypothetical protein
MQTTRQQFAILKFEWAAKIFFFFQLLQTGLFNQCETTVFRKIIALLLFGCRLVFDLMIFCSTRP